MENSDSESDFWHKYKIQIATLLVGIVLIIGGLYSSGILPGKLIKNFPLQKEMPKAPLMFKVDVSGAVNVPGVYSLSQYDRVEDAINAAGGLSSQFDPVYLAKSINFAQKISDGMKIYVPFVGEVQN